MSGRCQTPGGKTWANLRVGDWADAAACQGADPDLWFPTPTWGRYKTFGDDTEAKKVCAGCPVIDRCLEHALTHHEPDGVWGGASPREREALMKARKTPQEASGPILAPILIHGGEDGYKAHLRRGETPCRLCREGSARAVRERRARRKAKTATQRRTP